MKITIDKNITPVNSMPIAKNFATDLRKNKHIIEDMQTLLEGIQKINGVNVYAVKAEIDAISIYATPNTALFQLKATLTGWYSDGQKCGDFIAKLTVYGRGVDGYFEWDEALDTGAPSEFSAKMYREF